VPPLEPPIVALPFADRKMKVREIPLESLSKRLAFGFPVKYRKNTGGDV